MKKKLFALGALSTIGATLVAGTPAFAADADGTTNITYQSSTTGPIGPIDPNNPDTDPNNWMVQYPKTISLNEQNKLSNAESGYEEAESLAKYKAEYNTKAKRLEFRVMRQVAGTNGLEVSADNIGNGIEVTATADSTIWQNTKKEISMKENGGNSSIKMAIGSNKGTSADAKTDTETDLVVKDGVVTTLTHTAHTKNGYAVIVDSNGEVDGKNYSTTVTFQFTRK